MPSIFVAFRRSFILIDFHSALEQPMKIPFAAAVVLYANDTVADVGKQILARAGTMGQTVLESGDWRGFKLILRFLACIQVLFEGDGIWSILDELFNQAVDLQAASSEDTVGLELVKIILLTIPYAIAAAGPEAGSKASEILEKTEIIASAQHNLDAIVKPYPDGSEENQSAHESLISLLQKQLQNEASQGWPLACIPKLYKRPAAEDGTTDPLDAQNKHPFPTFTMPTPINPGPRPLFPETHFSLYEGQDIQTVPKSDAIASSLIRDALADTINILDFNRIAAAKILIEMDCYWNPDTFAPRATQFDKLREAPEGKPTWKPEDMAVDAIFSQIFQLPTPQHKLVYYHSVITEACKLAPAAIAPSLGRGIRFLFRNVQHMDMELAYRFMDWFAHHLSNFEFRWKWTEWIDDISRPDIDPRKAFIVGALDKEIRLSFAKRIRETLPKEYHALIPAGKEKDIPDFKYTSDGKFVCNSPGRMILGLHGIRNAIRP
jgi:nuclear cap-binding protein subunit 1